MTPQSAEAIHSRQAWQLADIAAAQVFGEAFFALLTERLAAVLGVDHVLVGENIQGQPGRLRTLSVWSDGSHIGNFEYDTRETPCEAVVGKSIQWYESGVAERFPSCKVVKSLGVECYVGLPLWGGSQEAVGVISIMHRRSLPHSEEIKSMLRMCAARAAVEIERFRAEAQLRLSEQRLSASVDSTPHVAVQWYDEEGLVRLWNKASEKFYGYSAKEMIGCSMSNGILSDESMALFVEAISHVRRTGQSVGPIDLEVRRRDGTLGYCESTVFGIPGEGGRLWYVRMDVDSTARRRAEKDLLTSETQYRHMIASSPVPMLVTDLNQRILLGNTKFTELFGYTLSDIPDLAALWSKAFPNAVYRSTVQQDWSGRLAEARDSVRPMSPMEVDVTCKDQSVRRGQMIASYCSDRLMIVFMDLTDRSRLENELRHAQKLEVVGQLAGGVAHDFNNIIQGVLGFIGLSMDPTLATTERDQFLREALSSAKRASQLTRQLLAFGRRQAMHMEDTNLPELVNNLLKLLRRLIGEHIELKYVCGQGIGNVRCDRTQLEQVLINLCVNARDAMPQGGRITISIESKVITRSYLAHHSWARMGHFVVITVTDTGCGMDVATQERVFEPFFTTKPKEKGSGLGLAVVYGIVRQHEGLIRLSSQVGVGTTFCIYIPVTEAGAVEQNNQAESLPAPGGSETVLVAEDDETIRNLIRRILERAGYQVVSAMNGEEAVELYQANSGLIALMLFDAVMPKLSGFEAYARIRNLAGEQVPPVVFASGYNDAFTQSGASLPKDAVLIQKPYDPDELLRRIRKIIGKSAEKY